MRFAILLICACGSSSRTAVDATVGDSGSTADADPCSGGVTNGAVPGCVLNGLASIPLDGMWTLTGTVSQFSGTPKPYTAVKYMLRTGTGRCAFTMSSQPITTAVSDPNTWITDTIASSSSSGYYPHSYSNTWSFCVRESDGMLAYHEHDTLSMPMMDTAIEGVLTR